MNILIIFIYIMLFFPQHILAVDNVPNTGKLYRVETRDETDIFENGFSSFGDNDSVRNHSRGVSCVGRGQNSNFISTSSSLEYAESYARRLISAQNPTVYVYFINSTSNIYNMARSLDEAGYATGIPDARRQSEWIAHGNINRSSIQGVRRYTAAFPPPLSPPIVPNTAHYIERQPIINNNPYISPAPNNAPGVGRVVANINPPVGACMAATLSCFDSSSSSQKLNSACNFVEPYRKESVLFYSTVIMTH